MTTKRCADSGTQVMTPARHGDVVACGNCGQHVTVQQVPLKAGDTNTIRVISEH